MTAFEIVKEASVMVGLRYSDEEIKSVGLTLLNIVLMEMGLPRLLSADDKPLLPTDSYTYTLMLGVAKYLCAGIGDARNEEAIGKEYRRELGRLKGSVTLVRNNGPRGEGC